MHYRNGREAKNGDNVVRLSGDGKVEAFVTLEGATAEGGDHCNGNLVPANTDKVYACLCDCIHVDDLAAILAEKGLEKRPAGM